jgi:hypothetical protein
MNLRNTRPIANPYTNRDAIRSPDDFFGRMAELRSIYTLILSGQSVSLVGERRVGKSSLLNALGFESQRTEFELPENFCFVFVDLQYIAGCMQEEFVTYLLRQIAESTGISIQMPPYGSLHEPLEQAAQEVLHQGRRLVVLMDEFDVLVRNDRIPRELFAILRAWAGRFEIAFVLASREGSIEPILTEDSIGSAFLNIFAPVYVGPLQESEARELIDLPAEHVGMPFTDEEKEWILQLGGHHPFYLQIACYHMFNGKFSDLIPERRREHLEEEFSYEAGPHLDYLLQGLLEREKKALQSWIATGRIDDRRARVELTRRGILMDDHGRWRIFSTVFDGMMRDMRP